MKSSDNTLLHSPSDERGKLLSLVPLHHCTMIRVVHSLNNHLVPAKQLIPPIWTKVSASIQQLLHLLRIIISQRRSWIFWIFANSITGPYDVSIRSILRLVWNRLVEVQQVNEK
jgi:hypothetical protein